MLSHKKLLTCLVLGGEIYFQLIQGLAGFYDLLCPFPQQISRTDVCSEIDFKELCVNHNLDSLMFSGRIFIFIFFAETNCS